MKSDMSLPGEDDNDDKEMMRMEDGDYDVDSLNKLKPVGGGSAGVAAGRISYKECLKNHAANIGGNVTDGCGEFMPSGEEGSIEALKCAACSCHRNFHRKEYQGEAMVQHRVVGGHWASAMVQPVKMAFGGTDSSSEELNFNPYHSGGGGGIPRASSTKKRFRTKFTADQKERMLEFAEKLGWRIPREDDSEIQRFCAEVGVKRQVFKVWMHNNKSASKKITITPQPQPQHHII